MKYGTDIKAYKVFPDPEITGICAKHVKELEKQEESLEPISGIKFNECSYCDFAEKEKDYTPLDFK